ncbi:hypothetical protein [Pricia sp.]|uniref:hypothetical protein n=1 Tax=Pricia sp. TaxID=2268138 RepID=UPI003593A5FA
MRSIVISFVFGKVQIIRSLILILTLTNAHEGLGQKNAIFFELAGNAQGGSVNYERQLSKEAGLGVSLGFGAAVLEEYSDRDDP